jgi:hypothetical protein
MIITQLAGGLGNQMFQYALGRYLALHHRTTLKLDLHALLDRRPAPGLVFRDYDLDLFNLPPLARATQWDLAKAQQSRHWRLNALHEKLAKLGLARPLAVRREARKSFDPAVLATPDHSLLQGFWQSYRYFAPIEATIRQDFAFRAPLAGPAADLAHRLGQVEAICVNVRRADFVDNPKSASFHGFVGMDYYARAIEHLRGRGGGGEVFVFSDDVAWCQANLRFPLPTTLVGHEYKGHKFGDYLHLMTRCQHFVIPNSTFGWWAAWLANRPAGVVVVPQQWYADPQANADTVGLLPDHWVRL